MDKKLKTSSCILPISKVCMQCKAHLFSENEKERQEAVIKKYESLPPDCVSSPIDGIKCPFKTGKAYEHGQYTQKIPQRGVGYAKALAPKQYC